MRSCDGTTQGESESGGFYPCSITPIVDKNISYSTCDEECSNESRVC